MAKTRKEKQSILSKLSVETTTPNIKIVTVALAEIQRRHLSDPSRRQLYRTLCDIYHLYRILKRHHISKQTTRLIASRAGPRNEIAHHPLRIMINAVFPTIDRRQQSRRFQALDFARYKKISSKRMLKVLEANEGVAGLARLNARRRNRQRRYHVWD